MTLRRVSTGVYRMHEEILSLVAQVHRRADARAARVNIAVAGPGATGASALFEVSGASSTVNEVCIPYNRTASADYVGAPMAQFSSASAAETLANAAYERCVGMFCTEASTVSDLANIDAIGVGSAGAIATSRDRRGANACHVVSVRSAPPGSGGHPSTQVATATFQKGSRERAEEEQLCGALLVSAVANTFAVDPSPWSLVSRALPLVQGIHGQGGQAQVEGEDALHVTAPTMQADPLSMLLAQSSKVEGSSNSSSSGMGAPTHVLYVPLPGTGPGTGPRQYSVHANVPLHRVGTGTHPSLPPPVLLVPGSYNPFHSGHERMACAAALALEHGEREQGVGGGRKYSIVYELSAANVDKPPLDSSTVLGRVSQFVRPGDSSARTGVTGSPWPVVVTRAPRFLDKAALFPACTFVIGFDTAARLLHPKYYSPADAVGMTCALLALVHGGTRWVVAGRAAGAAAVILPPSYDGKPEEQVTLPPDAFLTFSSHLCDRVHPALRPAFTSLSEAQFRDDISSTALRAKIQA